MQSVLLLISQSEKSADEEEKSPKGISEATKRPEIGQTEVHQPGIKLKLSKPLEASETEVTKSTFVSELSNVFLKKKIRQRSSKHFDVSSSSSDEDDEKDCHK